MNASIVWFRQDLRLTDNPALTAAVRHGGPVIPVFIDAIDEHGDWPHGSANRWWLHHSLESLSDGLKALGSRLILRQGNCLEVLCRLAAETGACAVFWNRLYEPAHIVRDRSIKQRLRSDGLAVESFNSALLAEPWEIATAKGEPYRVFTPYSRAVRQARSDMAVLPAPRALPPLPHALSGLPVGDLALLPKLGWDSGLRASWRPGEPGAMSLLEHFADQGLPGYAENRDRPDQPGTSRLSPHLRFGEIGPRQILSALLNVPGGEAAVEKSREVYWRELIWREFAHHLLFHYPQTVSEPLNPRFADFPWNEGYAGWLSAWQRGNTGYPLVDAGMRELWNTGWMHNRVRMAVASFLTKNLRVPWQQGARWFWDTLVDADLANNTFGWQWSAGCGADAAPYFRIFNPVLQGQRFDPSGDYVRRWIPELARLPASCIHQPWLAPPGVLEAAGVRLGDNYPAPIVELKQSRDEALGAFARIKSGGAVPDDR